MKRTFFAFFAFFVLTAVSNAQTADITELLETNTCYTCHSVKKKMVGPTWTEIAKKNYTKKKFIALVAKPVPANWPTYSPMAPLPKVPKADLGKIYDWVTTLK
jgi:cytochrome c